MSEVKTFDCEGCRPYCYGGYHMEEDRDGDGDYVKTADYKQLCQQLEAAKEQAAAAQAENLRIADCAAKLIKSYASQWRKDFETTGHAKTGFIAGNVRTSELGELISLALAQQPSRAALDAYVAERVIAIQAAEARINKPENEVGK